MVNVFTNIVAAQQIWIRTSAPMRDQWITSVPIGLA
jgi:hypothetical protein